MLKKVEIVSTYIRTILLYFYGRELAHARSNFGAFYLTSVIPDGRYI